jgi:single-strand DNA-binding protein
MNVNQTFFGGNITRAPECRYSEAGLAIVKFGVASNRYSGKDDRGEPKKKATFVDVVAFGKRGEAIHKHLGKGDPIFIQGHLSFSTWEDKNTGTKRSKLELVVDDFQFLGRRGDRQEAKTTADKVRKDAASDVDYGDIPF